MTPSEFNSETARLSNLIAAENEGKRSATKSLDEKVAHNRERNRLQEILRQHKLNYYEVVAE